MSSQTFSSFDSLLPRRHFLNQCGIGLGGVALAEMLGNATTQATVEAAPREPHFAPKGKRVIYLLCQEVPRSWTCSITNLTW